MYKYIFCFFTLCVNVSAWALPSDGEKPLIIRADSACMDQIKGVGRYEGHVHIQQGTTQIRGKTMITYTNPQHHLMKIIINGDAIEKASYKTQPQPNKAAMVASARLITFLPPKQQVILEGDAKAQQGKNSIEGPHLEYDMIHQQFNARNTHEQLTKQTQQTTIVIQPETLATNPTLHRFTENTHGKEIITHA